MTQTMLVKRSLCLLGPAAPSRFGRCVVGLLSLLLVGTVLHAQPNPVAHPMDIQPFVSAGYAYMPNKDLTGILETTMHSLQAMGVPISPQVRFGNALTVSVGVLTSRIPDVALGLSVGYHYSPSYAGYSDYAGTLRLDGKIHRFEILFSVHRTLFGVWRMPVSIAIEPGYYHTYVRLVQDAQYAEPAGFTRTTVWSGGSDGVGGRITLEGRVMTGPVAIDIALGYGLVLGRYDVDIVRYNRGDIATATSANIGGSGMVAALRIFPRF